MNTIHKSLAGFIEANSDICRNRDDQQLVRRNDVKYVFDADILDLFVRPSFYLSGNSITSNRKRTFSLDWGIDTSGLETEKITAQRAQHALIMGEYLLSRQLPGSDGRIYFTPWHMSEIQNSFHRINSNLAVGRHQLKDKLLPLLRHFSDEFENYGAEENISVMSEAIALLAEDRHLEPISQMRRFYDVCRESSAIISDDHMIADHIDESLVAKKANQWLKLLQEKNRTRDSIRNDALSLAYLREACKVLAANGDQTLIFVTGDNELFDIYRNWFYTNEIDEPFFLRRFAQYNPTLNTKNAKSIISGPTDTSRLFESIDNMVSAVVIRHALSSSKLDFSDALESILSSKNRFQWLAWKYAGSTLHAPSRFLGISKKEKEKIDELKKNLAWIQEKISGTFYHLAMNRLPDSIRTILAEPENIANFHAQAKKFFEDYLGEFDKSAIEFFENATISKIRFMYGLPSGPHRTPDTVLHMINGRTLADIVDELDENANSRDPLQVNFRNFSDLRAYAAAIALSTRFWADAEQYAKAARELASSATATHELDFLVCVTSRYSIADRFSTDKANGIDGFQRHWEEFDKLTRVLKQIKTKIGLRFNSETAAIRIFKSEAMLVSGDYQGAALALRKALKDIYFCLDEIYANGDHHHSVVDQVTHNYASAFILATLIKSSDSSAVFNGFTSRRTTYVADYFLRPKRRKLSAFLNLEKELFRVLVGAPCESSESVVSYLKKSMTEEKNLGMDSLLCNMIEHRISSVGIAGIMEASKTIVSK